MIYKLDTTVKHYAWGSSEWIPQLTGRPNPALKPWAELWMGVHKEGPSKITETGKALGEFIAGDPAGTLGEKTAREFGNLPFLLKFLAAAKPLSIQAHPNLEQARRGWEKEKKAGEGNYHDANHKPEVICALSSFSAMAGFRPIGETQALLEAFFEDAKASSAENKLKERLLASLSSGAYRKFLHLLLSLGRDEAGILAKRALMMPEKPSRAAEKVQAALSFCGAFAGMYPEDPAIIAPLYLNLLELRPGEAIYIPSGTLHAYIRGFGVECMANSDNVLRGGLTDKRINAEELLAILDFAPYKPEISVGLPAENSGGRGGWLRYPAPIREFTLFRLETTDRETARLEEEGAALITLTRGAAEITVSGPGGYEKGENAAALVLKEGESAFVPRRKPGEVLAARGCKTAANNGAAGGAAGGLVSGECSTVFTALAP